MRDVDTIILVLVWCCVPAVNLYPLLYVFRPWRTTPQGRALMVKACGNVILIDMALAYATFGDYAARETIRVIGFTLFALGINYLFWTLLRSPGAERYPPQSWLRRLRRR